MLGTETGKTGSESPMETVPQEVKKMANEIIRFKVGKLYGERDAKDVRAKGKGKVWKCSVGKNNGEMTFYPMEINQDGLLDYRGKAEKRTDFDCECCEFVPSPKERNALGIEKNTDVECVTVTVANGKKVKLWASDRILSLKQ